jgi:hypothetical protein
MVVVVVVVVGASVVVVVVVATMMSTSSAWTSLGAKVFGSSRKMAWAFTGAKDPNRPVMCR